MAEAKDIITTAVESERFGSSYCSKLMELVSDEKAERLIKSLADDEKEHTAMLEKDLNPVFKRLERMELEHLALLGENRLYIQDGGVWYGYVPLLD